MTIEALDNFKDDLEEQLGVDGVFTEHAIYDPDTEAVDLYGVFDDVKFRDNKGAGNVEQKKSGPRFIVSELGITFDIYADKQLELTYREKTYTIKEIDSDSNGAQVLWLA